MTETRNTPTWHQRFYAWALARFNTSYELFIAGYKKKLFESISGTVLEIGPGTGANLRYFSRSDIHWVGIEPNPAMYLYLSEEVRRLGMRIQILSGTSDHLPIADCSIDAVVSTLVLCSVNNLDICLREVLRVLKPGGKFVFIEHVAAPQGSRLRIKQNLLSPLWRRIVDGCHPNRETWIALENAGFERVAYEKITAPLPIVGPQIVGIALKSI